MFNNKRFRQVILITYDVLAVLLSMFIAFYVRFDENLFTNPNMHDYLDQMLHIGFTIVLIKIVVLYLFKMYSSLWQYASIEEAVQIVGASIVATLVTIAYMVIINNSLPRSIYIITFTVDTILFAAGRLAYRTIRVFKERRMFGTSDVKNIMIIGAGKAGSLLIKELRVHKELKSHPTVIIDDDKSKIGKSLNGVPIVGSRYSILYNVKKYDIDQIIIAIPSLDNEMLSDIIDEASRTNIEVKIVPGLYEIVDGNVNITKLRNVEIADLLGREEVELDNEVMYDYVTGKNIMVTGGAGSIGSELCRQIARFRPQKLIVLDNYENNTYLLELELKKKYPHLSVVSIIANIRERNRIFEVVKEYRPYVVFHAAAHKHVPLMETSPVEAIKNNVFGTKNVMDAADKYGVSKFVMISTDKAVNPANVMGASKRIAEMMIQSKKSISTKFVAVRFGNVLGSNGSVVPIFKKQIEEGGPVTVTHRDIERYFMTIPEACKLVIQASVFAKNNEIFVLDMGEPVKIVTLAENLIRLSGYTPYEDIKIKFTGLREGEKMFEELILNKENSIKTENEKIFIEKPESISDEDVDIMLDKLRVVCEKDSNYVARDVLREYIATYAG